MKVLLYWPTLCCLLNISVFASDGAYLDPAYKNLKHPINDELLSQKSISKNDVLKVISLQTTVKSQLNRGTCSIFSATGYLESILINQGQFGHDLDLAEEWLQYLIIGHRTSDGSSAPTNFNAIKNYGMPSENTYPYIGEDWTNFYNPLKDTRCGHLTERIQISCYLAHRDTELLDLADDFILENYKDEEFVAARKEASKFSTDHLRFSESSYYLNSTSMVKNILLSGLPVILELDFFYGAWNHRKADEYGIGRDMDQWNQGIVTSVEYDSVDWTESKRNPAGHSIIIVGFDNDIVISKNLKMNNGENKTYTYKGVYYFKNSWGTSSFGRDFKIEETSLPGYGMISQEYAQKFGSFFQLQLL